MRGDQPGQIALTGVSAFGHHGVLDHERADGQQFVVDVLMEVDLTRAAEGDDLADTVNYAEVAAAVVAAVEGPALDLIEALAGRIADAVLLQPLVEAVDVVVHKPQAPVGVPFGDVSVRLRRERSVAVVIALGANLDEPAQTLVQAGRRLRRVRGLGSIRISSLHLTQPVGGPEQPPYVNAVAVARTRLAPHTLLAELHRLEEAFGRTRSVRWGPRTLDLDLVQYGPGGEELRQDDPMLTLPHPRAHERAFVLAPWAQVEPDALLHVAGRGAVPVADLLAGLDRSGIRLLDEGTR